MNSERQIDSRSHISANVSQNSDNKRQKPCVDPVGSHIIELRNYYLYLEDNLERRTILNTSEILEGEEDLEYEYSNIPAFPSKYPFSDSIQIIADGNESSKMMVKNLRADQVEEKRIIFITKVLEQSGFFGVEDGDKAFKCLSAVLDEFLQKFVGLLSHNRVSDFFSEDLWSSIETTIRSIGMGGISGLHSFYYENVAKKHDILLEKCMDMYEELEDLDELQDLEELQDLNELHDLTDTSEDDIVFEERNFSQFSDK